MTRFAIGSILWSFSVLISCSDRTFEEIPMIVTSSQTLNPDSLFQDSIQIQAGLFYRQLSEKGYRQIYGHARVVPAHTMSENHSYDLVFLSGQLESQQQRLICSIDPNYHSVIDVITYLPHKYRMISLQQSSMASTFTDIRLLDISVLTKRPDTLLVQANMDGILDKIPLCCEF
ncbi:MAG: hypothetical protein IPL46_05375 [Saprospiraceae bacterium]|nr:hypothetical protein [Saprospiraceae bacterium]